MPGEDNGGNGFGHVEELDDQASISDDDVVLLVDEEGVEHSFVVLAIVEADGQSYAMLTPESQLTDDAGDQIELFLFKYATDDEGNELFSPIEDDETYERVRNFCATLMETDEE